MVIGSTYFAYRLSAWARLYRFFFTWVLLLHCACLPLPLLQCNSDGPSAETAATTGDDSGEGGADGVMSNYTQVRAAACCVCMG